MSEERIELSSLEVPEIDARVRDAFDEALQEVPYVKGPSPQHVWYDELAEHFTGRRPPGSPTVRDIQSAVEQKLLDLYGPAVRGAHQPPDGLRLELHPSLVNLFFIEPGFFSYSEIGKDPRELLSDRFRVPVKVTIDIPKNHFRLVVVTEEVLLGGAL